MEVRSIVPSKKQRLLLAEEVRRNHEALLDQGDQRSAIGRSYLTERGINDEMIERWKLGYVEEGTYRNRVSIPYWTPAGYSGMVYRCLHLPGMQCKELDHHEKYLALPGYRPMFNVRALSVGADRVFITEGEIDAIVATYYGYPCVSVGNNRRWSPWWTYMFDGPREKIVLADGDDAGKELVERVRTALSGVSSLAMPDGMDVSSLVKEQGAEALHKLVRSLDA